MLFVWPDSDIIDIQVFLREWLLLYFKVSQTSDAPIAYRVR